MSSPTKVAFLLLLMTSPSLAQNLEKVVAVQQAKIADLQSQIASIGCGTYGKVVFNSVANRQGPGATGDKNTAKFWNIPYAQRFAVKGEPTTDLSKNYYNGDIYRQGPAVYTDLIEDLAGNQIIGMRAQADGVNQTTMAFMNPQFLGGNRNVYNENFAAGWSAPDYDGDTHATLNCAVYFNNVTQHYSACWSYNIGSDADAPYADNDWGPHFHAGTLANLASDGTTYTRASRITRCAKAL